MLRNLGSFCRQLALVVSIPFVAAAAPSPSPDASVVPAHVVALPTAGGSWLATLTISGGFVARFKELVIASDGSATSPSTGPIVLDAAALARISAAVSAAHETRWSIPAESTCCDRVITRITLARRFADGRSSTFTAQTAESGTPLPADAGALVAVLERAFATNPPPTSAP